MESQRIASLNTDSDFFAFFAPEGELRLRKRGSPGGLRESLLILTSLSVLCGKKRLRYEKLD